MKYIPALFLLLVAAPCLATTAGQQGVSEVYRCIMQNDPGYCRSILTPESEDYFNRFSSYKLMPCLPTDFTYMGEEASADRTTAKVSMPAGGGRVYIARLIFVQTSSGPKLDLPATFHRGFGENWQDKVRLSEQLYLMMKQNMGNRLTCDTLTGLVTQP